MPERSGARSKGPSTNDPRVVLIGGLDDGMMVAEVLNAHPQVDLVGIFTLDEEAGAIYSGYRMFEFIAPAPVLHEISRISDAVGDIESLAPDLIVVSGYLSRDLRGPPAAWLDFIAPSCPPDPDARL